MSDLSKDSYQLLCIIYKEYLTRRNSDIPKSRAKYFDSASFVQTSLCPYLTLDDVEESLRELGTAGFLHNFYADNTVYSIVLENDAIVFMENRFKKALLKLLILLLNLFPDYLSRY